MSEKIDICTTAAIRPQLLDHTFNSFTKHMLHDKSRYRLIINIDPIGEKLKRRDRELNIAKQYFDDVVFNFPETPGFTKAVQWCWSQTTAKYLLHLEDDWKLLQNINIDWMIEMLEQYKLTSLRLSKERIGKSKHSNKFGFIYWPKISLNPTLFKGNFVRQVEPLMNMSQNPEKQLRPTNSELGKIISKTQHGVYTKEGTGMIVLDIGRQWMNKSRFKKKTGFLHWEVKPKI